MTIFTDFRLNRGKIHNIIKKLKQGIAQGSSLNKRKGIEYENNFFCCRQIYPGNGLAAYAVLRLAVRIQYAADLQPL